MDGDEEDPEDELDDGKHKEEEEQLDSVDPKGDGVNMTETERMKLI